MCNKSLTLIVFTLSLDSEAKPFLGVLGAFPLKEVTVNTFTLSIKLMCESITTFSQMTSKRGKGQRHFKIKLL